MAENEREDKGLEERADVPQSTEPERRRSPKLFNLLALVLGVSVFIIGCLLSFILGLSLGGGNLEATLPGDKIAYVKLTGPIVSSRERGSTASMIVSDEVVPFIYEMLEDDEVKGMLLVINSPGGSATASYEIYSALMRFRERKPVVVYIRDVAASGGYYISSAGTYVIASPSAVVGNIGAIMINLNVREMLRKLGVKPIVLKSSKHKDLLSSFREPTPEERELLEGVLRDIYEQFKRDVLKGRAGKISEDELDRIADGRIFSGLSAKEYKLVDDIGTLKDAEAKLKELLHIPKGKKLRKVVFKPKRGSLTELLDALPNLIPDVQLYTTPSVLYR